MPEFSGFTAIFDLILFGAPPHAPAITPQPPSRRRDRLSYCTSAPFARNLRDNNVI